MAYTHSKYEVTLLGTGAQNEGLDATATTVGARWAPGYIPHIVRAITAQLTATGAPVTAPVISIRNVSPYSAAGIGATGDQFTSLTFSTGDTSSTVRYADKKDQEISVGDMLVAVPSTKATGSEKVVVRAYVEPRWETPANATGVLATG
ncbi:MAG: hypothetical protein ACE5JJ_07550 [Nitrospinota bacterium]